MKNHVLTGVLIAALFSSCSYKNVRYFQDVNPNTTSSETIGNYEPPTIQAEDILGLHVTSLNPDASDVFNNTVANIGNGETVAAGRTVSGYMVDQQGNIQIPLIGNFKVGGLTLAQVREKLQKDLIQYLKEPVVNVRFINFKVSVMGDVMRPGVYPVDNQRVNINEALTMAGDLNVTAMRKNLILVREVDGNRQYIPVDLTSKRLFTSPYYYLKPNDLIYVQPGKQKFAGVDKTYQDLGLIMSALSIIVILLTR